MNMQEKKSMPKKGILFIAIAVIAVVVIITLVIITQNSKHNREIRDHLSIGRQFLEDEEYRKAIAEFLNVLEIDPKNIEAYLDLADAYVGLKDWDHAMEVLQEGYELTNNDVLSEEMSEIEQLVATANNTQVSQIGNNENPSEVNDENTQEVIEKTDFELLKEYYLDHFTMTDVVCMADVTHDGRDDMVVVHSVADQNYIGYVLSVSNGKVYEVYSQSGASVHVGGFFCWYLKPDGEYWNIVSEEDGMWQGYGWMQCNEFWFTQEGQIMYKDGASCESPEDEPISNEAYNKYEKEKSIILNDSLEVYDALSWTHAGLKQRQEPSIVLQFTKEEKDKYAEERLANIAKKKQTLEIEFGKIDTNRKYQHSYSAAYEYGDYYPVNPTLDKNIKGVLWDGLVDLDGDEEGEILLFRIEDAKLICGIYKQLGQNEFTLEEQQLASIVLADSLNWEIYLKQYQGKSYLIMHPFDGYFVYCDGCEYNYKEWICHYGYIVDEGKKTLLDTSSLFLECNEMLMPAEGLDFQTEEMNNITNSLKKCGMFHTAEDFYGMEISSEDQAQLLFRITAKNTLADELDGDFSGVMDGNHTPGDVSVYGKIEVGFQCY